jgi:integrase
MSLLGKRLQVSRVFRGTARDAKSDGMARLEPGPVGRAAGVAERCTGDRVTDGDSSADRAAEQSRRPEYARAILVSATTGLRRAEVCGLRSRRDLDVPGKVLTVSSSAVALKDVPMQEIPTKNRRTRTLAIDGLTSSMLQAQLTMAQERAEFAGVRLVDDHYVFSDEADGSVPWKPDSVSQYFGRLRDRAGIEHLSLHSLRKFMETYGQEMGYSVTQVALRAGHNPSVAARYYSGKVAETDRALAEAVASLLRAEV